MIPATESPYRVFEIGIRTLTFLGLETLRIRPTVRNAKRCFVEQRVRS